MRELVKTRLYSEPKGEQLYVAQQQWLDQDLIRDLIRDVFFDEGHEEFGSMRSTNHALLTCVDV